MKNIVYISIISLLFVAACSTKKNSRTNRFYHNVTTKNNVLYNGNIAFEQGVTQLAENYEDNYWEILPIEPLEIDEDKFELPGKSKEGGSKTPFDIAEEKAVKAVQKHSMQFAGEEHNKQIDDAYMLLGKSRYYSQRFVPALEAFEYIIKNYPKGDLHKELIVWKAKTQIRLQNEEQAMTALKKLLAKKDNESYIKELSHTALAMAYMALDSVPKAIEQLENATKTNKNEEQYTRNLFILGQLYRNQKNIDSSQIAFNKILKHKKSPYKYKMHAYMEQVKNTSADADNSELKKIFAKNIKHYENRFYLGGLYYHAATLDFFEGNEEVALEKLKKSIQTPLVNDYQKGKSYEAVGNYYFDKAKFVKAGAYYDSVIPTVVNQNTKRIRRLKRKIKSLEEIIYYETVLETNDSIYKLIAMDTVSRRQFFESHIAKIKKEDEIAAIQKENATRSLSSASSNIAKQSNKNKMNSSRKSNPSAGNNSGIGKWYFYNPQTIGFGKVEFTKTWGGRKLQDNWRLSSETADTETKNNAVVQTEKINESKKYDISYYLKKIPSDKKKIAKMHDNTSTALYQLGLIYKEQFKEYPLAISRLERFLVEDPKEKQILPAKYHLYKIFEILGDVNKMNKYKQDIITDYPDSRYTQVLLNPNEIASYTSNEKTPEKHYEKVYCDYDFYEKYQSVFEACEKAITQYNDEPILPKFELLKSFTIFKLEGKKPFMKSLEYVVGNYPKTEEAERAQEILDMLNGVKKEKKEPIKEEKAKNKAKKRANQLSGKGEMSDDEKQKILEKIKKKRKGPRSFKN